MNSEASPIAPMTGHSAFIVNRHAKLIELRKRRSATINFPMWVKTTPCFRQTNSFLVRDQHGTTRELITKPINQPFTNRTRQTSRKPALWRMNNDD